MDCDSELAYREWLFDRNQVLWTLHGEAARLIAW